MKKEQDSENNAEQALTIPVITCRYFIYVFYRVGNVGSRDVKTINEQPEDGFETELEAEEHLKKLILSKKGHFFHRNWYKFTILKTWNSLSAV
jgi:hypothetical protein